MNWFWDRIKNEEEEEKEEEMKSIGIGDRIDKCLIARKIT